MEPSDITAALGPELARDEELLWSGQPRQGVRLRATDIFMIPFSILWGGFAIFWTVAVTRSDGWVGLLGLPFLIIGLFGIFGRFYWDSATRRRTVYGVTSQRLIIIRRGRRLAMSSTNLDQLGSLELKERSHGRATILFGPITITPLGSQPGLSFSQRSQAQRPQFDSIEDGRRVFELIRDAASQRTE